MGEPAADRLTECLICIECSRHGSADARGWRAYLSCDHEVAIFCPECAGREFGGS